MNLKQSRTHFICVLNLLSLCIFIFFSIPKAQGEIVSNTPSNDRTFLPFHFIETIEIKKNKPKGIYYFPSKKLGLKFSDEMEDSESLDDLDNQIIQEDKELLHASFHTISVENVDQIIYLINHFEGAGPHIKISIVIEDKGIQESSLQRYAVYLTYLSTDEKSHISGSFLITDKAYEFIYIKKFSRGNYEINVSEHDPKGNLFHITYDIDAIQIFIQEEFLRSQCRDSYCKEKLRGPIRVKKKTFDPYSIN